MFKGFTALLVACLMAVAALTSCGDERAFETEGDTGDPNGSIFDALTDGDTHGEHTVGETALGGFSTEEIEKETITEAPAVPEFTAEEIVQAYVDSYSLWKFDDNRSPMYGQSYSFIDVDFDGVLELVASICDGSGRFSSNKYYRVNTDDMSVELFWDTDEKQSYEAVDYNLHSLILVKTEDGRLAYVLSDSVSAGMAYGVSEATVLYYYADGAFHREVLGSVHYSAEKTYSLYNSDGDLEEVSLDEYNAYMKEHVTDVTVAEFGQSLISADDSFKSMSSNEKHEALLEIYEKFTDTLNAGRK